MRAALAAFFPFKGVSALDWSTLGQYGIATVALALLAYALKLFHDAYNLNTSALNELKIVIERQTERENSYYNVLLPLIQDTNERVRIIEIEVRK